jgi:hypothetical protein
MELLDVLPQHVFLMCERCERDAPLVKGNFEREHPADQSEGRHQRRQGNGAKRPIQPHALVVGARHDCRCRDGDCGAEQVRLDPGFMDGDRWTQHGRTRSNRRTLRTPRFSRALKCMQIKMPRPRSYRFPAQPSLKSEAPLPIADHQTTAVIFPCAGQILDRSALRVDVARAKQSYTGAYLRGLLGVAAERATRPASAPWGRARDRLKYRG